MKKMPPSAARLPGASDSFTDSFLAVSDVVLRLHAELSSRLGTDNAVISFRKAEQERTVPSVTDVHQSSILTVAMTRAMMAIFWRVGLAPLFDRLFPVRDLMEVSEDEGEVIGTIAGLPELMDDEQEICEFITTHLGTIADKLWHLIRRTADAAMDELEDQIASQSSIDPQGLVELLDLNWHSAPAAEIRFYSAEKVSVHPVLKAAASVPEAPSRGPLPATIYSDPNAAALRQQVERQNSTIVQLQDRLAAHQRAKDDDASSDLQLTDLNRGLRARIRALELALGRLRSSSGNPPSPQSLPTTWDDLSRFADERLAGNVVLSNKAIRAARGSVFEDISFAYAVLLMLAEDYVPMRRGDTGARERYEATCVRLRVDVGPTGGAADMHRTKAAYRVQHLGKTLTMDLHVRGSSARDPRDGFRLYFTFYCPTSDHDGYVVVGSFPAHLDNTRS